MAWRRILARRPPTTARAGGCPICSPTAPPTSCRTRRCRRRTIRTTSTSGTPTDCRRCARAANGASTLASPTCSARARNGALTLQPLGFSAVPGHIRTGCGHVVDGCINKGIYRSFVSRRRVGPELFGGRYCNDRYLTNIF